MKSLGTIGLAIKGLAIKSKEGFKEKKKLKVLKRKAVMLCSQNQY